MIPEIECTECGWQGFVSELQCSEEDSHSKKSAGEMKFNLCPDCQCEDSCEDYEE